MCGGDITGYSGVRSGFAYTFALLWGLDDDEALRGWHLLFDLPNEFQRFFVGDTAGDDNQLWRNHPHEFEG